MKKITLRPLLEFINKTSRPYMTLGDWTQFEDKINKRRRDKINAQQSPQTEDEYLKIIVPLRELFTQHRQVKTTAIITAVNKALIKGKYGYRKQEHRARNGRNVFYPVAPENYSKSVYDLAFYHSAAGQYHIAHHTHGGQSSVYYMRCEEPVEHPGQILFGNMQIDARNAAYWTDPSLGKIMLQTKNIYGTMVQQAIKHGLERGKKEILFQCGDANEFAQWDNRRLKPVTVTKRNYKKFQLAYETQIKKFGPKGYQQGEYYALDENKYRREFVIEASADSCRIFQDLWHPRPLLELLRTPEWRGPGEFPGKPGDKLDEMINVVEDKAYQREQKYSYTELLTEIKNFLNTVTHAQLPKRHSKKELALAKHYFAGGVSHEGAIRKIDQLFHQLDYDKLILKHFPALKKLILNNGELIYYNSKNKLFNHVYRKSDYQAPELGQTYITPTKDRFNINFASHKTGQYAGYRQMHDWYEKTLYQELKKHKLGVERVPITTIKRGRKVTAHAWKIKSGLAEFKKRPIAIFSTRGELKMDCETLPRLQTAAAKFGCTPSQLTIVNDFLTEGQAPKRSGAYEKDTGEIYLANHSLAILAHEGLHKLKARGVIPAAEYRALVQAGKRIAQTTAKEKAYINQRDAEDNLIYPPGRARNEEYAAIFVETYYENNRVARKNLLGKKLTVTEKVFDYIKTVRDTVLARVGMPAACARKFLRRVEGSYYQTEVHSRPPPASMPKSVLAACLAKE